MITWREVVFGVVVLAISAFASITAGTLLGELVNGRCQCECKEMEQIVDPSDQLLESLKTTAWHGMYLCEFNVRYRELAGDDGLKGKYADLGERYRAQWEGEPSRDVLAALYLEKAALAREEQPPVYDRIDEAQKQLDADIKAGKWPEE